MGALVDTLLSDQRRLEQAAETIPGLLVMEFEAPAKSPRAEMLMATNAEQRELIAALQERNFALAENNAAMSRRIAELTRELATATGANAQPQPGCRIVEVPVPGGKLLVEVEPDDGYPADGAGLEVLNVFVGGRWIDTEDLHVATDLDRLRESVAEVMA